MVTVQEYVLKQLETIESTQLARELGISVSMLSSYKKSYNPSLEVAKKVFKRDGIVLHPFAEESIKYEIKKDIR